MSRIRYGITEEVYSLGERSRLSYGIAAYTEQDGTATIVASVRDITSDKAKITALVRSCNRLALSPLHLRDVIEDFLAN